MKQSQDLINKPYYRCFICTDFRKICGGMPTRGLTLKEWCELIRDTMDYFDLTPAYVSKESGVSQRTVERVHTVNTDQDFMRSTCRSIEIVVFGEATRLMCKMDHDPTLEKKIEELQKRLEDVTADKERLARVVDFITHKN